MRHASVPLASVCTFPPNWTTRTAKCLLNPVCRRQVRWLHSHFVREVTTSRLSPPKISLTPEISLRNNGFFSSALIIAHGTRNLLILVIYRLEQESLARRRLVDKTEPSHAQHSRARPCPRKWREKWGKCLSQIRRCASLVCGSNLGSTYKPASPDN